MLTPGVRDSTLTQRQADAKWAKLMELTAAENQTAAMGRAFGETPPDHEPAKVEAPACQLVDPSVLKPTLLKLPVTDPPSEKCLPEQTQTPA